jgi:transposase
MDADWLASRLAEGRSIESIAREAGRSPSTVAYWVNKHGLTSRHAAKHASRGGIDRTELEAMVALGMPIRAMADQLGVSYTTVRHWLKNYGLITPRARRLAETAKARAAELPTVTATCPRHDSTSFGRTADGHYRCLKCRSEAVAARRRRVKERLVAAAGGSCVLCGYDRSAAALHFHHLDPTEKAFAIAGRGVGRSLAMASAEAHKCVLLCATCHAEVEAGLATLPATAADQRG